jgi:DNA-binding transcriptional MerR regulator
MGKTTIGDVANSLGVTPKTIRLWEERGLIHPHRRENGYRAYGEHDLAILRFVKQGRDLGFTLRELKEMIDLRRSGCCPCQRALEVIDRQIATIAAEISRLEAHRAQLSQVRDIPWADVQDGVRSSAICHIVERAGELIKH